MRTQFSQDRFELAGLLARPGHHHAAPKKRSLFKPVELIPQADDFSHHGNGGRLEIRLHDLFGDILQGPDDRLLLGGGPPPDNRDRCFRSTAVSNRGCCKSREGF